MAVPLAKHQKAARGFLAGAALLIVVLSFARVIVRELGGDGGGAEVELVVMHWSGEGGPEEDAIVERCLADYEAAHPGVRVRRINPGDAGSFYTKLQTMMAAGTPPDVFYMGNERLAVFAASDLLLSVEPFLAADAADPPADQVVLGDYYPATVEAFRFDGERSGRGALYGIPKDFTTVGFYYNVDLFERAGIPPPPDDWTWDDFHDIAARIGQLKTAGGENCTGSEFVTWPPMIRAYLRTEGVDVVGDDFGDVRLRDPVAMEALERLRAWRHDEEHTLTSGKSKAVEGSGVLNLGTVGMAGPFGRWVVPAYREIEEFRWDFAPLPRGRERSNVVLTVAWAISASTDYPEECWELVRALCSPRSQAELARLGLAIPTLKPVAESDAFLDPGVAPSRDRAYLAAAEVAEVLPWPATMRFESLLQNRMNQALKTGDLPLEEAVASFEQALSLIHI